MKNKKTISIIEQSIVIIAINLLLFYDGLLTTSSWSAGLIIAFTLFHSGAFFALYKTIKSVNYTKQKDELIFNFNFSIYLLFICVLLLNNFLFNNEHLLLNYFLSLFFLFISIGFIVDTRNLYSIYKNNSLTIKN
jgi:hypothetical protein